MKKILIIVVFSLLSLAVYSQKPFKIHNPDVRFLWGADSMRFLISKRSFYVGDTLVFSDGTKQWSADSLSPGSEFWKLTLDKLEPKISTNYINTDSSYYLKGIEFIKANHNLGNQFIGVGSGANNIVDSINNPPYGYLGVGNTANGYYSLYSNTTGSGNTANGYYSLYNNTTGNNNVANGAVSLYSNTTGYHNVANGAQSLYSNTTGIGNIAIGYNSGYYADTAANGLLWIGEGDSNAAIIYGYHGQGIKRLRLNADVYLKNKLSFPIFSATINDTLTPTEAELTTAIGLTPAEAGSGSSFVVKSTSGCLYDIISDGANYYCTKRKKLW